MLRPLALTCLLATLLSLPSVVRGQMTFYVVAVGQGECAIIQCPNSKDIVIVDMGTNRGYRDSSYINNLLKKKFDAGDKNTNIHVVVTHPHTDHYNLFGKVLDADILPNIREFVLGGELKNYNKDFLSSLQKSLKGVYTINNQKKCFGNSQCKLTHINPAVTANAHWQFCPGNKVTFTVLGANIGPKVNGESVIFKVEYEDWSMLMSGDFEQVSSQEELINHYKSKSMLSIFKAKYYKVAHHGAWTDTNKPNLPALLNLIQPEKAYISHAHPSFGHKHPKSDTINNLVSLPSIVKIPPLSNSPFVYWDRASKSVVTLQAGLDRAIYETCRGVKNGGQVCQDIEITIDDKGDSTKYVW